MKDNFLVNTNRSVQEEQSGRISFFNHHYHHLNINHYLDYFNKIVSFC